MTNDSGEREQEMSNAKWEYATDSFYPYENDLTGWLNGWGEQGWEVFSAVFRPDTISYRNEYYMFIFKRQKPQP